MLCQQCHGADWCDIETGIVECTLIVSFISSKWSLAKGHRVNNKDIAIVSTREFNMPTWTIKLTAICCDTLSLRLDISVP